MVQANKSTARRNAGPVMLAVPLVRLRFSNQPCTARDDFFTHTGENKTWI